MILMLLISFKLSCFVVLFPTERESPSNHMHARKREIVLTTARHPSFENFSNFSAKRLQQLGLPKQAEIQ